MLLIEQLCNYNGSFNHINYLFTGEEFWEFLETRLEVKNEGKGKSSGGGQFSNALPAHRVFLIGRDFDNGPQTLVDPEEIICFSWKSKILFSVKAEVGSALWLAGFGAWPARFNK